MLHFGRLARLQIGIVHFPSDCIDCGWLRIETVLCSEVCKQIIDHPRSCSAEDDVWIAERIPQMTENFRFR